MKKLHLIAGNDSLRPALTYIQVKSGRVNVTNALAAISAPINEVFGSPDPENCPLPDEFYILAKDWKAQKFYNAARFALFGDILTAYDNKYKTLGMVKIVRPDEFVKGCGRYPDVVSVMPEPEKEKKEINGIGLDPELLVNICSAVGSENTCKLDFFGPDKVINIRIPESEIMAIVMPKKLNY